MMHRKKLPSRKTDRVLIRDSWPFVKYISAKGKYQVDTRTSGGGGCRRLYDTQEQALEAARIAAEQKKEFGTSSYRNDELTAFGWTVADAVKFALDHLRSKTASRPIAEAVEALLTLRAQEGCSALYLESLRHELKRFTTAFDGKTVAEIKTADVAHYLSDAATAGARNTRRKHLVTLFSFSVKMKWTEENPPKEISKLKEKFSIQTLSPSQMIRLLSACDVLAEPAAGAMRAYIALAGFAGIRPEELHRLNWANVDLVSSSAFIDVNVSKVGEARNVPLSENCKAWLETSSTRSGLVSPKAGFRYRFEAVRAAAGFSVRGGDGEEWQADVLRHSFASYWLAIHKNRNELAEHMGNSAKIIGKHYRRVIAQTEAQDWFAILPTADAEAKVLRMG
jgi:integrase